MHAAWAKNVNLANDPYNHTTVCVVLKSLTLVTVPCYLLAVELSTLQSEQLGEVIQII
jgi:hypothetical protein